MGPSRHFLAVLMLLIPFSMVSRVSNADSADAGFTVLWNFSMPMGYRPPEPSLFSATPGGALYGTTLFGGPQHLGSVFRLTPPSVPSGAWNMSVLRSFSDGDSAFFPRPGLVDALPSGEVRALYGTTEAGGGAPEDTKVSGAPINRSLHVTTPAGDVKGAGTVFKLAPPSASNPDWALSVLHRFVGIDGARPNDTLLTDASGALYGTTAYGGAHGQGTVFKLTPLDASHSRWTVTVLYSFSGDDGAYPNGGLVSDPAGALYGTTYDAGGRRAGGQGTVFKLAPPIGPDAHWTLLTLHAFSGPDGGFPQAGLLFDKSGALWGTTTVGGTDGDCGVVFKLTPPSVPDLDWSMTLPHIFPPYRGTDGCHPAGGLVLGASGVVYGTDFLGAGFMGGVYKLIPPTGGEANWALTVLHSLQDDDGQKPLAGLISDGAGTLYGTTTVGGQDEGGTVFRLPLVGQQKLDP
jgi:uncharacterized repeat protein (TIGR03803 family)